MCIFWHLGEGLLDASARERVFSDDGLNGWTSAQMVWAAFVVRVEIISRSAEMAGQWLPSQRREAPPKPRREKNCSRRGVEKPSPRYQKMLDPVLYSVGYTHGWLKYTVWLIVSLHTPIYISQEKSIHWTRWTCIPSATWFHRATILLS